MEMPKISIVTPSFNQAQYLDITIKSVLNQQYPNLEYIIIDGGSTDGSQEIIKKYESHLAYWCSEPDGGQYDAINKGFAMSTGEIMAWLNSDDLYFPWTFHTVASVMTEFPDIQWISSLLPFSWDADGFFLGYYRRHGFSFDAFLDSWYLPIGFGTRRVGFIQQESSFWRRSLWLASGGHLDSELALAGDFELWSRFFESAHLFGVDAPLAAFRTQPQQKSRDIDSYIREAASVLEECRRRNSWSPNMLRNTLGYFSLFDKLLRVFAVRTPFLMQWFGYSGKRVVRKQSDAGTAVWQLEERNFLPYTYE